MLAAEATMLKISEQVKTTLTRNYIPNPLAYIIAY